MLLALQSVLSECPPQLKTICLKHLAEKLDIIVAQPDIQLPTEVWESLIDVYQHLGYRVDDCLLLLLGAHIRRLHLRNASVSDEGVAQVLSSRTTEIDLRQCPDLSEDLLKHINEWGENLQSLTIGSSVRVIPPFITTQYSTQGYIIKAPNLKRLTLNDLVVKEPAVYPTLVSPLTNLNHLDLSHCHNVGDLSYLVPLQKLASLVLYNVKGVQDTISSICKLKNLRHLDISQPIAKEYYGTFKNENEVLSTIAKSLPHLNSLDISGTNLAGRGTAAGAREFDEAASDIPGLASRASNPLHFLGLYFTHHAACKRHHIPAKVVSGDANEKQLLVAASVFMDRPDMLQNVLNDMYFQIRYDMCSYIKECLEAVIHSMDRHISDKHIQITGSATLFYLVKHIEKGFNTQTKQRLIWTLLNAMEAHSNDITMMRNGCLTLSQFKIPHELFYFERLVKLVLHVVETAEGSLQGVGITLLNSLACQVDSKDKELMGDYGTITRMLAVIEQQLKNKVSDEVLDTAWSTMWNATDETPRNCQRFLDGNGMELFLNCLKTFPDKEELMRNMLGLLGNVAEVSWLRPHLMNSNFVTVITELLDSSYDGIEVSYNAAGVLSHMASDGEEQWTIQEPSRVEALRKMVIAIERWDLDTERNINYRSFEPILSLLQKTHTPECQHWAVWALANLTRVYPDKYCVLVEAENGLKLLDELVRSTLHPRIRWLAIMVVTQCYRYRKGGSAMEVEEFEVEGGSGGSDADIEDSEEDDVDVQLDG